jgi:hypothetical protein
VAIFARFFVELHVEYLVGGSALPGSASDLLYTNTYQDGEDLPLRGTAVSWGRASLSLHGAQESVTSAIDFVSSWKNQDGMGGDDHAPGGIIQLANTVLLGAGTSTLSFFVDATCFAGAEESRRGSVFALFECRDKPAGEIIEPVYIAPMRMRVHRITAYFCELVHL